MEKAKILVADDREESRLALEAILGNTDYDVVPARSSDEALASILRNDFALVILSFDLREAGGVEVARLIKSRRKSRDVPVLFVCDETVDADRIRAAYEAGAVDCLAKPFAPEILRAKTRIFAELFRKARLEPLENDPGFRDAWRYQDLLDGVNSAFVWSADPDTLSFSYVSPRAELLLGYPIERWKTEPGFLFEHIPAEDREIVQNALRGAREGKDLGIEHRFVNAEGEIVWLHTGIRLARKGEGVGVELRGLTIDITYQKHVEEALKDALQIRDDFLSIASHELKTPLTTMVLQLELLEHSLKKDPALATPAKLGKIIDTWRRQVDRLVNLIDNLLDVSKISGGKFPIERSETDLREVVDDVLERFATELNRVGIEVRLDAPPSAVGHWDRGRVEQVLANFISNVIKYAPGNPVDVRLGDHGGDVEITVTDHGNGIPPEQQAKIFDRYERGGRDKGVPGLGLGLYIAKNIVESHGGTIDVRSLPGAGATFTVRMPKHSENAELQKARSSGGDQVA